MGGGKVGGNMGNTRVQWGGRGWLVACRGQRQVKVSEKEKQTKWMAKKDPAKKMEKKINKKVHGKCLGESTHHPNQEGSEARRFNHKYLGKGPICLIYEHI